MDETKKTGPDYKSSVFLPQTTFPMKGDLVKQEPLRVARWQAEDLYGQIRAARKGAPKFIFHDGPPYANSDLHLGHALNHSLKDFVVKSRTLLGYDAPFRPGWDCHGLPIEQRVEKAVGRGKLKAMSAREIRALSRAHAEKVIERQRAGIQRLGVLADYGHPYITMDFAYEAGEVRAFGQMYAKGLAYKALKPVHWCASCHTALAEAEIEYEQKVDPSIFVRLKVVAVGDGQSHLRASSGQVDNLYAIIWTTTPWTLPANRAVAVHPEEEYVVIQPLGSQDRYLIAKKLQEKLAQQFDWVKGEQTVAAGLKAADLADWRYLHPLAPAALDKNAAQYCHAFYPADYVEMETGSGLVHTAPGHGHDDYQTGLKYKLEIICPVDAHGVLTDVIATVPPDCVGRNIWDANPLIIARLKESGLLMAEGRIDHSFPCCWRCHSPLLIRATPQWFIGMDKKVLLGGKASLRELALQAIDQLQLTGGWVPAWGYDRIRNMIAARPDWCISRQRLWGVPIAVFICENKECAAVYATPQSFEKIAAHFEIAGCDDWFEKPSGNFLPADAHCAKCGGTDFAKETDILDVWFDSGASHRLALDPPAADQPWADLYLEGSDQHRGWFHTSLLIGVALDERAPYRQVLTHGFTLDGQGRPMSKSLGNGIDPDEINNKYGAEVLRLWVAASDYGSDIRLSPAMLTQHAEGYRKIRNTLRFMLGVLQDFDPATELIQDDNAFRFLDHFVLLKARALFARVALSYEKYEFHALYREINEFVILTLSNFYLSLQKDTLYINPPDSQRRRSAQSAVFLILKGLIKALAPLLPFTAEEAYAQLPAFPGKMATVQLDLFDCAANLADPAQAQRADDRLARLFPNDELLARGEEFLFLRDKLLKGLEKERAAGKIGDALEAVLYIEARAPAEKALLQFLGADAALLCGVSEVHLQPLGGHSAAYSDTELDVWVMNADESPCHPAHAKCARCWWRTADVGSDEKYPGVCARCAGFLAEMKWTLPGAG